MLDHSGNVHFLETTVLEKDLRIAYGLIQV